MAGKNHFSKRASATPDFPERRKERDDSRAGRFWTLALCALIVGLFVALLVRAATLSMTYDEAYTVSVYAADGSRIFSPDDFLPNNHVLHTILVWLMFQLTPWSEAGLRLPAVLGGLGIILLLSFLARYLFGTDSSRAKRNTFLAVAMVSLHPLLFQFFSFARGYSLSLFFSLLGFFLLLRLLVPENKSVGSPEKHAENLSRRLLFGAGLSFGLSVAANLTAALTDTPIILTALLLGILSGRFGKRALVDLPLFFCLPGLLVVVGLYFPFFLNVSFDRFEYASPTPWDALFDLTLWSLGNSDVVPLEWKRRLLFGIPISEDTFWLAVVLLPTLIGIPVATAMSVLSAPLWKKCRTHPLDGSRNETAFLLVLGGLAGYAFLLLAAWFLGKTSFPKDRTGVIPIAYALLLPVLTLHYLESAGIRSVFRNVFRRVILVGCTLSIVQFSIAFAYPFNHNLWYADADIRSMMRMVARITEQSNDTPLLVFAANNEAAIDFYRRKYKIDNLETYRLLREEQIPSLAGLPRHLILLLPREGEGPFRERRPDFRLLRKNRFEILFLADCPHPQESRR